MTQNLATTIPSNVNLPQLAYELAAQIHDVNAIISRHSINAQQLRHITTLPHFRQMYRAAKAAYEADDNLETRLQTKARLGLEENLAGLANIAKGMDHGEAVSSAVRVQAAGLLHEITGLKKARPADAATGDKFVLNITTTGSDKPITIEASPRHEELADAT